MSMQSSSPLEKSSRCGPLNHKQKESDTSYNSSNSNKRKRGTNEGDDTDSRESSSIGWNPEWDDNDGVNEKKHEFPPPSIHVATDLSDNQDNTLAAGEEKHHNSSSRSSDDGSHANLAYSQLTNDNKPMRYQMLGAPILVYRHTPSYKPKSTWPSPLAPQQIEMALYLREHPLGSWFKAGNTKGNRGETYPHSIQKYMPRLKDVKKNTGDHRAVGVVDQINSASAHQLKLRREHTSLKHKSESSREKTEELEKRRLKWLEWKLRKWQHRGEEKSAMKSAMQEYYMDRDINRLVYHWEKEDKNEEAKKERIQQKCNVKKAGSQQNGVRDFSLESRDSQTNMYSNGSSDKNNRLELRPQQPNIDESFSTSSTLFSSDCSTVSEWSSSTSSICTYYSDESEFHQWEEKTLLELNEASEIVKPKKRELLSSWIFDGDPDVPDTNSKFTARYLSRENGSHKYSINELTEMVEMKYDSQQILFENNDAPFHRESLENEVVQQCQVGGAFSYGNCLVVLKCTCSSCVVDGTRPNASSDSNMPTFFLVHPTGVTMSCVTISKLCLPCCASSSSEKISIDVDCRILQLSVCGKSATVGYRDICLVARTSTYCCILIAHPKAVKSNACGAYECPVAFELSEKTRIDLRTSPGTRQPSYVPFHVACDPKTCISFFTKPSFAVLCVDENGDKNSIHHTTLQDRFQTKYHNFSHDLSDISLIEFDPRDRRVLWAAARPAKMPLIAERFFKRRGVLTGYGHSLYRLDLRDNSATFVWSPSHDECLVDGAYSISGIMPDALQDHILWVSSTSAGKTWALDMRYKRPKVLVRWSLPSLSDDLGVHCNATGIHGAGVLMTQQIKLAYNSDQLSTMFSIKKDTNTSNLNVYQFPSSMPRFQTRPLESSGFVDIPTSQYHTTSIARSTTFALPDVSDKIFNIGIASLELPSVTALSVNNLKKLGYKTNPSNSAYIFTMSNIGDVYCHALLACDASEESKAKYFPGLPVGATSIPVPNVKKKMNIRDEFDDKIFIQLTNTFPVPSSAILASTERRSFGDFKLFDVNAINTNLKCERERNAFKESNRDIFHDVFQQCLPTTFHGLDSEQVTNEDFQTLLVTKNERLKTNPHLPIDQNELERHIEVIHPIPVQFGISATDDTASKTVELKNKHVLVAIKTGQDETATSQDLRVGDLSSDLLEKLQDSYFMSTDIERDDTTQLGSKTDSHSDDDE